MLDLNRIKLVAFDYDDTLCIHQRHLEDKRYRGESHSVLILCGEDEWKDCLAPEFMKKFVRECQLRGIEMGLISCTDTYLRADAKLNWVNEQYGIKMKNYCVGTQEMKIPMLQDLQTSFKLQADEILYVDDMYAHLENASKKGFISCSPTEIACYVETLSS